MQSLLTGLGTVANPHLHAKATMKFKELLKKDYVNINGIKLAQQYADFCRGAVTNNESEHPGLGHTVRYHGAQDSEATVYIYTAGQSDVPDGPSSDIVMAEFNRATAEIITFNKDAGMPISLVGRYGTGSPQNGPEFLCAELLIGDEKDQARSFLYLSAKAGCFLKLRVTISPAEDVLSKARQFADAVAADLKPKKLH